MSMTEIILKWQSIAENPNEFGEITRRWKPILITEQD